MSPPYARFEKLDESKQEAILSAATQEFVAHGYELASLNQVIEEAGISKGSFYYYFEDKLDLFVTVLEGLGSLESYVKRALILESANREEFWRGCRRMVELGMEAVLERPEMVKLGEAFSGLSQGVMESARVRGFIEEQMKWLVHVLTHGQEVGAVRRDLPMEVAVELWMGLDRVFSRWGVSQMTQGEESIESKLASGEVKAVWELSLDAFRRLFEPAER